MRPASSDLLELLRASLAAEPGIAVSYLFGSRARGTARPDSDVDVAVLGASGGAGAGLALLADRGAALHPLTVDLVVLDTAPVALAYRVLRDGVVLSCTDEARRVAFTARTIDRYLDMAPMRAILAEGTARRLREGSFGRR